MKVDQRGQQKSVSCHYDIMTLRQGKNWVFIVFNLISSTTCILYFLHYTFHAQYCVTYNFTAIKLPNSTLIVERDHVSDAMLISLPSYALSSMRQRERKRKREREREEERERKREREEAREREREREEEERELERSSS